MWIAQNRLVAKPTSGRISGSVALDGVLISIDVSFSTTESSGWDSGQPLSLIPQPAEVFALARTRELRLGLAFPSTQAAFAPARHSSDRTICYSLYLTNRQLSALEGVRDGNELVLRLRIGAHAIQCGGPIEATECEFSIKIPRDEWVGILRSCGFCETLVTELRLPPSGDAETRDAHERLTTAVLAKTNGAYAEAMRRCRTALDALSIRGFGGKAPTDVANFLQDKARSLTPLERVSALQVAFRLFLAPAAHANAPDEDYTRDDADLALAITASLIKLARRSGGTP